MSERSSANFDLLVSRTSAREAYRAALRRHIGRGKRHSVKQAAIGSGVAERMIEAFMAPVDSADFRRPDLEEVLSLASFLGPDFTSDLTGLAGQGAYWLPETDDTPPGVIAADNSDDAAVITRAAMDGEFRRDERPALQVVGRRMMARGAQLTRLAA